MKLTHLVACCVCILAVSVASAQEKAQVEFVHALKNEYGPRLADEYLKRLQQKSPAEYTPRLALEAALIKIELAEKSATASERLRLTREAEAAIKGYTGPEAKLTNIKILNLQARALRLKAWREDERSEGYDKSVAQALSVLDEVGRQLDGSITQLAAEIPKAKDADAKKELERALMQAEFDYGVALYDHGDLTKFTGGELLRAKDKFDKVAGKKDVDPPLSVVARAWQTRCMERTGDKDKVAPAYTLVEADTTPNADAGRREASYFHLLWSARPVLSPPLAPDPKTFGKTLEELQKLGALWLTNNEKQAAAAQVAGAHFIVALATYDKAELEISKVPVADIPKRKALYDEARKHFHDAERTDNEYSFKARSYRIQCFVVLQGWSKDVPITESGKLKDATASVPLKNLTTFDDLADRAQFEIMRLGEKLRDAPEDKIAGLRTEYTKRAIEALQAAIALAKTKDSKVPEDELTQARLMLTYAYMAAEDAAHTVEEGQKLVDENSPQAADAAVYVLQGYSALLRQLEVERAERTKAADKAKDGEERQKLTKLRDETIAEQKKRTADFFAFMNKVVANWPDEQAADIARHQQGMLLYNDKKYPQAIAKLAQVRPGYAAYPSVRFQLAIIAWNSCTEDDKPAPEDIEKRSFDELAKPFKDLFKKGESPYWKARALSVVTELQPPPAGTDPAAIESYVRAKMMLAGPYFKASKFKEMDAMFPDLYAKVQAGDLPIEKDNWPKVRASLLKCVLLSAYGKADQLVQAAQKVNPKAVNFQDTRPFFDPVLPFILNAETGGPTKAALDVMRPAGNDPTEDIEAARFRDTFMESVLRAYLLDGKGAEAARLTRALVKFYPEKNDKGEATDGGAALTIEPLIAQTTNYIADLRAASRLAEVDGKKELAAAKKTEADKLTTGFANYLGEIDKDKAALKPAYNRLLARAFLSIDQPSKALPLVAADPGAPADDTPEAKVRPYVEERVFYLRCLRETKKLDEADKLFASLQKKDEALTEKKLTPWFSNDVYFLIEECRLLDARAKNREAATKWVAVAQKLSSRVNHSRTEKELYFECYCGWVHAGYLVVAANEDPDKRADGIQKAAQAILKMEDRWPDLGGDVSKVRFLQLLDSAPPLKDAYTKLKADKKGS